MPMAEVLQENWLLALAGVLAALLVLWWLLVARRRTRVEIARSEEDGAPARRNQALIDAAPAAVPSPAEVPPATPPGLAGVGEAIVAAPAPIAAVVRGDDDLARIKGLGPKLVEQLHALGITSYAQIADWNEADIDRIDAQLGRFQGRIRRDDWPAQARLLAAGDTAGYEAKFGKL
jgi:predicted flap endonuclease-1-like 5' DNA nuclease